MNQHLINYSVVCRAAFCDQSKGSALSGRIMWSEQGQCAVGAHSVIRARAVRCRAELCDQSKGSALSGRIMSSEQGQCAVGPNYVIRARAVRCRAELCDQSKVSARASFWRPDRDTKSRKSILDREVQHHIFWI